MYNTHKVNLIAIKVGTKYSEWGAVNQGVCQGFGLFPLLFIIHVNESIRQCRPTTYSSILISRNDHIILANSEDKLQCSIYNLQNATKYFYIEISTKKTKIISFQGKYSIHSKIYIQ
jgi:hypothetical protein